MSLEDETEAIAMEPIPIDDDKEMMPVPDDSMFTSAGAMSDVTLLVEGRGLHVNRMVLSLASPVFRKMFEGEFKEKTEIPLVDKKYGDVVELLLCIYPSTTKIITKSNLETVLRLADEYRMDSLKERCGQILLQQFQYDKRYNEPSNEELVHFLYLADKYNIEELIEASVEKGKFISFDGDNGLKSFPEFHELSLEVKYRICTARLSSLEGPLKRLIISGKNVPAQQIQAQPLQGFSAKFGTPGQPTFGGQMQKTLSQKVNSLTRHFHNDPTI